MGEVSGRGDVDKVKVIVCALENKERGIMCAFKQKRAYEIRLSLVSSEMYIRDRLLLLPLLLLLLLLQLLLLLLFLLLLLLLLLHLLLLLCHLYTSASADE